MIRVKTRRKDKAKVCVGLGVARLINERKHYCVKVSYGRRR